MKELDDISLSWGFATDRFHDAMEVITKVFARSKKVLSKVDVDILKYIFDCTKNTERVS